MLDCGRPLQSRVFASNCTHLETRARRGAGRTRSGETEDRQISRSRCHFGSFACTLVDSGFSAASADLATVVA
jgi:hypothetical protein